jgi:cytochrome c oxidase subunit 3
MAEVYSATAIAPAASPPVLTPQQREANLALAPPREYLGGHPGGVAGDADHPHYLHHHFNDIEQQREATTLSMWGFLATEIMMFGGLFVAYTVYRHLYFGAFHAGGNHLNWVAGTINTGVLLVSSLTMAMAVHYAQLKNRKKLVRFLIITMALGTTFLVIKYFEWSADYHEGLVPALSWFYYQVHPEEVSRLGTNIDPNHVMLFFALYFCMTGLHAIHMIVALGILSVMLWMAWRGQFTDGNDQPIEIVGLYWHLIDIIWIFLFPLLYLTGGIKFGGG